jgi:quercetin dioxygenase-like cupin family protein
MDAHSILKLLAEHCRVEHIETEREELDVVFFGPFKDGTQVDLAFLEKGSSHPPHIHDKSSAQIWILLGSGVVQIDGVAQKYSKGDTFVFRAGSAHGFEVSERTVLLSVQNRPIKTKDWFDFRYADEEKPPAG